MILCNRLQGIHKIHLAERWLFEPGRRSIPQFGFFKMELGKQGNYNSGINCQVVLMVIDDRMHATVQPAARRQ
jgi:hypothetical protein